MSVTLSKRRRLTCLLACCCLLTGFLLTGIVGAHTGLEEASPGNGEQVETAPEELELTFSGDGFQLTDVVVTGPDGERIDGETSVAPESDDVRYVSVADAGDGVYTVSWELLSDDGHTVTGAYFFVVGDEKLDRERILGLHADEAGDEDDGAPYGESATKGLLLVGVIGLLGIPVTLTTVVSPATRRYGVTSAVGTRRARSLVFGSALLLFGAALLLGAVRLRHIPGGVFESAWTFLGTPVGRTWVLQLVLAGATVAAVRYGIRSDTPRYWLGSAFAGGFAVAFTIAWTSHSATLVDRVRGVAMDFGHVFGAAVWVGGLLAIGLIVPPYLRAAHDDHAPVVAARATALFSVLAVFGVASIVGTGLLLTAWHVPDVAALWETTYGTLLSAKVALVFLALGLGGFNRVVLLRRLDPSEWRSPIPGLTSFERVRTDGGPDTDESVAHFVRSVRIELALLLVVVLITGALTSAPTAATDGARPGDGVLTGDADGIEIIVEPTPSKITRGTLVVGDSEPIVFDVKFRSDSDPVSADDGATLFLRNEEADTTIERELESVQQGTYSTVQALPAEGEWELRVEASVDGAYRSEWFDLQAGVERGAEDDSDDADSGGIDENYRERGAVGGNRGGRGMFALFAQFGALLVGIVGSAAVVNEARRASFPRRVQEQASIEQFSNGLRNRPSGNQRRSPLSPVLRRLPAVRSRLDGGVRSVREKGRPITVSATSRLRGIATTVRVRVSAFDASAIGLPFTDDGTSLEPTNVVSEITSNREFGVGSFGRTSSPPTTGDDSPATPSRGFDVGRVVDVGKHLERGDEVRLATVGYEWANPLTVVDSEVVEWLDDDGKRRFTTARIRLTTDRNDANDHVIEATSERDEIPMWRQGDRRSPVTRFETIGQ